MRQNKQNQNNAMLGKIRTGRANVLLAAAGGAGMTLLGSWGASPAHAQPGLYFDSNGATSGLGGSGTWNFSNPTWTTTISGNVATEAWVPGDIAAFAAAGTVTLTDTETIGGINLSNGAVTIATTAGNTAAVLNIGSGSITINSAYNTGNQMILVPIVGSGNITYNYTNTITSTSALNLSGAMGQFSGNLYVNPGFSQTNLSIVQLDSSLGTANGSTPSTSAIYLGNFALIGDDNPFTGTNIAAPTADVFTNYNSIITGYNYTGTGYANAWVAAANGSNGMQKIETYAGVISGNSNVTFGIGNSGGKGTVILGATNTYQGNTYITLSNANGLLQLGVDNAIPSTSTLTFGPNPAFTSTSSSAVAPFDLNGHNLTIAGLATNTTNTSAIGVGNIYNTNINSSPTLTIAGSANTTYKGDIGDFNIGVAPFNATYPYVVSGTEAVGASTNIALTIDGPGALTLAPVSALTNGNEYSGQTTINNNGGLVLGRVTGGQAGQLYTLQSSNIVVNSGATLSTVYAASTSYVGGTGGSITLNSGSIFNPGGITAPNNTAVVSSSSLVLNGGATLNFDVNSLATFDQLVLTGGVTLSSGTNTINITSTAASLPGGDYPIIQTQQGFSGTGTFTAGTLPTASNGTTYSIGPDPNNPDYYDLVVKAPALQWDPTGNGSPVTEDGGTWTTGSPFLSLETSTDVPWSNTSPDDVLIGNNSLQGGGTISLGSSVVVNGQLTFGPIYAGENYTISNGGNPAYTLTTTNGITANSSAEIDSGLILAQSQSWSVDSGQTLLVTGTLNQSTPSTLTASGPGTIILSGSGGNISALQINAGTVALEAVDALGTAPININGGTLGLGVSSTFTNNITFGASGGGIEPYNGASPTISGNLNSSGNVTVGGSGTLTLSGTNTFGSLTLTSGTLAAATNASLGSGSINFSGGGLNVTALTTLANNFALKTSGTAGQGSDLNFGPAPFNYSGSVSGSGDLHVYGSAALTLSGSSSFSGGALYFENPITVTVTNPAGLSTGTVSMDAAVTLDIETPFVNAGPIRGDAVWTKTGPGQLNLSGSAPTAPGAGLGVIVQQGNIQLNSVTGLGADNNVTSSSVAPQAAITLNPGTQLLINTSGQRASGNITLAGGSIVRLPTVSTGDFGFTIFSTDVGGSTAFVYDYASNVSPALTVTANSLIDNQQQAVASAGASNDLMIGEPVVVNTGVKLTLESDNTAGNYEQAGIILRGSTNNTTDPYQAITLQPAASIQATGTGDVDFGGTARGEPIIGEGTPGSDAVLQLGSHSLLRDGGAATQFQNNTDTTRLIIDGTGTAGLRIEAPMNSTYTVPNSGGAPALRTYDGTTGLFGINTTATATSTNLPTGYTTLGNDFTVFSPNRAEGLSNTYNLPSGTIITPSGTLTLAATDPGGATGVVNAGPAVPSGVSLALDNTAGSGNLVYQIDPTANGGTFANFAGLTVERSFPLAGTVTAQLLDDTTVPTLTLNGGALDIANHDLIVTNGNLSTLSAQAKLGYNLGNWNSASGIVSSAAASDTTHLTAVGVILNDDGTGQPALWRQRGAGIV